MTFSNHNNLGNLLGEFGWNKGRAKAVLWIWIFMLFPSLVCSLFLLGLPALIMSIYYIYQSCGRLRSTQPVVLVYEQGLLDNRKGLQQVIRYEKIKNIYISTVVTMGILNYVVTLETPNKQKIKIDEHVANVNHLRMLLEEQTIRQQLPDLITLYQQGHSITFNKLQVSQAGLTTGKRTLPWSEFGTVDIQRRYKYVDLIIFPKDGTKEWTNFSRDHFPNISMFFALVNYVQKTQSSH